jgi:hypothetical protein
VAPEPEDPRYGDETESVVSNGLLGGGRDRDPPPSFDGTEPDALKRYLRDLELWRWEADVPKVKHAAKMLTDNLAAVLDQLLMRCRWKF